jgi:hypothetical protein
MKRTSPLVKGLITGTSMVAYSLVLLYLKVPANAGYQYVGFAMFAAGIAWTLVDYSKSPEYSPKFGDIFGQGFRCFIIVALLAVIFTAVYGWMNPDLAREASEHYRADLIKNIKESNRTLPEIESMVKKAREQYVTGNIMLTIFGTLIMGSIFTAAGAAILIMRRR